MKIFFLLLLKVFLINFSIAKEEYEISIFSTHISKKIETNKGYKFSISEALGSWQDNKGNYGKSKIIFYVEEYKNSTLIKGLGHFTDQENKMFWFIPVRETTQDAGVGNVNVIDANKKYSFLIKKNCFYAINYFEDRSFLKIKCN
ncbi:hypothetical protein OA264_03555 [Alphaproteobacteria bacterium]|nr:hypothetical protein [Alphaproteobacteria bacterium]